MAGRVPPSRGLRFVRSRQHRDSDCGWRFGASDHQVPSRASSGVLRFRRGGRRPCRPCAQPPSRHRTGVRCFRRGGSRTRTDARIAKLYPVGGEGSAGPDLVAGAGNGLDCRRHRGVRIRCGDRATQRPCPAVVTRGTQRLSARGLDRCVPSSPVPTSAGIHRMHIPRVVGKNPTRRTT
jgi:hypothetical protein